MGDRVVWWPVGSLGRAAGWTVPLRPEIYERLVREVDLSAEENELENDPMEAEYEELLTARMRERASEAHQDGI